MKILFPNHSLKPRSPDPDYKMEFDAALDAVKTANMSLKGAA